MTNFRKARISDIPHLVALVNSAYRGDSSKKGWTTEADLLDGQRTDPEGMKAMIVGPDSEVHIAEENESILGCIYVGIEAEALYVGMLTVNPTLQNRGMGKLLLGHVEEFAKSIGKKTVRMTVIAGRAELIAFYERRGYQSTGKTEPFPENDPRFGIPKVKGLVFHEYAKKI